MYIYKNKFKNLIWPVHSYFHFEDCFNTTAVRIITFRGLFQYHGSQNHYISRTVSIPRQSESFTYICSYTNLKGQTTIAFVNVNHHFWFWYSTMYTYHVCRHLVHIFEFGGLKEEWFKLLQLFILSIITTVIYVIQQIIIHVNTICFFFLKSHDNDQILLYLHFIWPSRLSLYWQLLNKQSKSTQ